AEADDHLRGGDRHHREGEHLAVERSVVARERDQREVRPVQHDLEREQHDQRAPPDHHAERADREQERRDGDVPGDVGPAHCARVPSRAWLPRTTPPTAAASRTIEVISKASRWSVRKSLPTPYGPPN